MPTTVPCSKQVSLACVGPTTILVEAPASRAEPSNETFVFVAGSKGGGKSALVHAFTNPNKGQSTAETFVRPPTMYLFIASAAEEALKQTVGLEYSYARYHGGGGGGGGGGPPGVSGGACERI
jgi:hypothetical protein